MGHRARWMVNLYVIETHHRAKWSLDEKNQKETLLLRMVRKTNSAGMDKKEKVLDL